MKPTIAPVINLLHSAAYSTLATQSAQLPGYPYATVVPNVLDECHRPLLLISALAEHTKNLLADTRISLSCVESNTSNVQTAARITLIGDAELFAPSELLKARYLRYLPDAGQYLSLDFMFFRIIPKRLRYIAGVGRMGWLEAADWVSVPAFPLEQEKTLIDRVSPLAKDKIAILGIDRYGIDYRAQGVQVRHVFQGHGGQDGIDEEFLRRVLAQLS